MAKSTVSTVASPDAHKKNIIALMRDNARRHRLHEVFSDFCEIARLSISNRVDPLQFEAREARYPTTCTAVKEGGFYGWPHSDFGQHVDGRVQPNGLDLVKKALKPNFALASQVAPLALQFYTGANLPAPYRGGAFIGEHGSWDRQPLSGYAVTYVKFVDGCPSRQKLAVVSGFTYADEKSMSGALVGAAQAEDGALLIADDVGNAVWSANRQRAINGAMTAVRD